MNLFRKDWTDDDADEWTVHDFLACALAMISYALVAIGVAGSLLLKLWGFVTLSAAIVSAALMYIIVDPKLRALSRGFAQKQQDYLDQIDKTVRWEK